MNAGIIASRYARAFMKYVSETGSGRTVYSQACTLVRMMNHVPQFKMYLMDSSDVSFDRKCSLLSAALDGTVDDSIVRFLRMVTDHNREEYFPRMLLSFIEQYRSENNIKVGSIVAAVENDSLRVRLENLFHDLTGAEVHLEEKVSPEIIGGFIFELDGNRLDASVDSQLKRIRRQLVEKNNRIV